MRPAVIGVGVGAAVGAAVALASRGPTLVEWPTPVRRAFPFVLGGLTGGIVGLKTGASLSLLRAATGRGPGPITSATPAIIGAATLGVVAVAGRLAAARVLGGLAEQGRELDDVNMQPPANPDVSGGPGSLVSVEELGREGARFVNDATTPDGIREVTLQEPVASPVRVFIGVDAASTPEQRVGLAMAELRRTGEIGRAHV